MVAERDIFHLIICKRLQLFSQGTVDRQVRASKADKQKVNEKKCVHSTHPDNPCKPRCYLDYVCVMKMTLFWWVAQVLPGAANAAAVATQVAALARRPPELLLQLLRGKGARTETLEFLQGFLKRNMRF